jgi:NADH-quinone oxidoreductase subunit J
MIISFYIASIVAIVSTLMVITGKNGVHALLYLIVSFLSVSVIFFILGAPFIAALEVIIYAGAIMVLFIFVVMMLNLGSEAAIIESQLLKPKMWIGPVILTLILIIEFIIVFIKIDEQYYISASISPRQVGTSLFGTYILGVELSAILLMAGIVGAYHLGKNKKKILHRYLKENAE